MCWPVDILNRYWYEQKLGSKKFQVSKVFYVTASRIGYMYYLLNIHEEGSLWRAFFSSYVPKIVDRILTDGNDSQQISFLHMCQK